MNELSLKAILGGNVFLFLTALDGFLRTGTAFFAFLAAGFSLFILVYNNRTIIKKLSEPDQDEKPESGEQ